MHIYQAIYPRYDNSIASPIILLFNVFNQILQTQVNTVKFFRLFTFFNMIYIMLSTKQTL